MLLPRVLTAIVGIPVMLWLVHTGGVAFALFIAGVSTLCCYEYALVLKMGGRPVQPISTILLGGALGLCATLGGPIGLVLTAGTAAVTLVEMALPVHSLDRAALTVFGAVFAGWM